jgi:hypothetical protein
MLLEVFVEDLNSELSVLSRAIAHPNLSAASSHVGISQSQLSRIVAKIEDQFGFPVLDRESRRHSGWTREAFELVELYNLTARNFFTSVANLKSDKAPEVIRIGTLEGLVTHAINLSNKVLEHTTVSTLHLEVFDMSPLEAAFDRHELDVIFTATMTAHKETRFVKQLGFQTIEQLGSGVHEVLSEFEYSSRRRGQKGKGKVLVTNSLFVRKQCIELHAAKGTLPSKIYNKKSGETNEVEVLLMGQDTLSSAFWREITDLL